VTVIFGASLGLYFISFYLIGRTIASAIDARRVKRMQAAAQKIPDGINSLSEKLLSPAGSLRLKQKIMEAGQPNDLDVDGLMALKVTVAIVALAATAIASVLLKVAAAKVLGLLIIFTIGGFFLPNLWLNSRIAARKKEISLALPDVLDMLTISVEAGLGFEAALAKVVKNFKGALSQEFFRFLQEVQLGQTKKAAWRNLANRINIPEINTFVLSILQADTFGISIGKVLRVQADEMRVKRRQRAEETAMKAPVKIVFPLVLCIFPALMIIIIGPAAMHIVKNLMG
jgi:tight adherence protein C